MEAKLLLAMMITTVICMLQLVDAKTLRASQGERRRRSPSSDGEYGDSASGESGSGSDAETSYSGEDGEGSASSQAVTDTSGSESGEEAQDGTDGSDDSTTTERDDSMSESGPEVESHHPVNNTGEGSSGGDASGDSEDSSRVDDNGGYIPSGVVGPCGEIVFTGLDYKQAVRLQSESSTGEDPSGESGVSGEEDYGAGDVFLITSGDSEARNGGRSEGEWKKKITGNAYGKDPFESAYSLDSLLSAEPPSSTNLSPSGHFVLGLVTVTLMCLS